MRPPKSWRNKTSKPTPRRISPGKTSARGKQGTAPRGWPRAWRGFFAEGAREKGGGDLFADRQRLLRTVRSLDDDAAFQNLFHLEITHAVADPDGMAVDESQRTGGVENDALKFGQLFHRGGGRRIRVCGRRGQGVGCGRGRGFSRRRRGNFRRLRSHGWRRLVPKQGRAEDEARGGEKQNRRRRQNPAGTAARAGFNGRQRRRAGRRIIPLLFPGALERIVDKTHA